jgi:two-component system, NtrC family, sensor kinase
MTKRGGRTTKPKRRKAAKAPRIRSSTAGGSSKRVAQFERERDEALEQLAATREILKVMSRSSTSADAVFRAIVESAARLCNGVFANVRLYDGHKLHVAATHNFTTEVLDRFLKSHPKIPDRGDLAGRSILTGVTVHVPDVLADPDYDHQMARSGNWRAVLSVPMMHHGKPIGMIAVSKSKPIPFSDREIDLLNAFADQAVIAIENVRLFDEVRARTAELSESLQQQTATAEVLRVIASSPTDVKPVLNAIVESACKLCEASDAYVALKDGDYLVFQTQHGLIPIAWKRRLINRQWPAGRAVVDRKPVHLYDVLAREGDEFPDGREIARHDGARTVLTVPLMREGESIGVIILRRIEVQPFSDKQIALLQTFADQAVIAIGNVRLFEDVQARTRELTESLEQQTATSEVLSVISSSAGDLVPVFDTMLGKAMDLCGADFGVLNTFDGELFRTAASRGLPPAYDDYRRSQPLEYGPGTAPDRLLRGEPIVEITDLSESDAYRKGEPNRRALVELGGARCLLAVPLLKDERVVGNVMIFRQENRRFTEKQIALLKHFAAQAIIAIENTRLLRELRASTDDLSESLQQQTATAEVLKVISRSAFDLDAVLITLTESATTLCESVSGIIYRRVGDVYRYAASTMDVDSAYREYEQRTDIEVGRGTLIGRVALEGRAVQIADAWNDPEYMEQDSARLGGVRAMLGVPLIHHGEPIGAFALGRKDPIPFSKREVDLVTTFADQAVIAIQNVRLFDEVQARTKELAASLDDLRTAQGRLIQTEKLASLGQLTAGIAHEIKNPLNFVNNFSALSAELTDELNDILKSAELGEKMRAEVDELTGLLKDNLEKVVQHGKRADSIVKNMLLHSREGSGEHRPADINSLLDESLNLAYHGARAEKREFNITLQRDFDADVGTIELFPQEVTRAFLNLIANGVYAATRRKTEDKEPGFEPTLRATTKNLGTAVEIRIRDNGTGIPAEVQEKMFNPFFTTKPAGEGTGLGLSMTHDIIVKQHGGRIDVDTEPGIFTEFIITLPRGDTTSDPKPE